MWRGGRARLWPGRSAWWCGGPRGRRRLGQRERNAGFEGSGDERVAKRVGPDPLVHSRSFGDLAQDAGSAVAVRASPVGSGEDRSREALTNREVDRQGGARYEGDADDLAPFAQHCQGAIPSFQVEGLDVRPVASETWSPFKARREMRACSMGWSQSGCDEQGADRRRGIRSSGVVASRTPRVRAG
jgi:hypothetical protein